MKGTGTNFLYFGAKDHWGELFRLICGREPAWVELAPLDKGLSGSDVLLGRWDISGTPSKFHVFKIGDPKKLKHEFDAISKIAAPLVKNFPNVNFKRSADRKHGILSQEFMGESDGSTRSLRQYIEAASDESQVTSILNRLYNERIIDWIPPETPKPIITTVRTELNSWIKKGDLSHAVKEVGEPGIRRSLLDQFDLKFEELEKLSALAFSSQISVEKGPVHGDLHAQNVIVDLSERISLIDFGWTAVRWRAIDYLWLECSLKFVVASPYASIVDLIAMEEIIDSAWDSSSLDTSTLDGRLLSPSLKNIAAGVDVIRRNARQHLPSLTLQDYRKGLIAMAHALTTFPKLNRVYLMHSMARNAVALRDDLHSEGPYSRLYQGTQLLWPSKAGRMVKKAAERSHSPGLALDVGCGDGKDVVYLEDRGWTVTGIDINSVAVAGVDRRVMQFFGPLHKLRGEVERADAAVYHYPAEQFDLVVAYGLYHCLNDEDVQVVHKSIVKTLRPGGLFAFAAFNKLLPVPDGHGTDELFLRDVEHIFELAKPDFEVLEREVGEINEVHPPIITEHRHSLTWALLQKK